MARGEEAFLDSARLPVGVEEVAYNEMKSSRSLNYHKSEVATCAA